MTNETIHYVEFRALEVGAAGADQLVIACGADPKESQKSDSWLDVDCEACLETLLPRKDIDPQSDPFHN